MIRLAVSVEGRTEEEFIRDDGGAGSRAAEKPFAVIFGATGLVGRHLAARLAGRGFKGWCVRRRGTEAPPYEAPSGFSWRTVPEAEALRLPASANLFSLVPVSALPALLARTVGGERLIALSTSSVRFKAESSDPHERGLARRLKRAEEETRRLCEERNVDWTIFRPTLIYDPGRDANVSEIAAFVRRFGFFPIVRPGTGGRQPIHADDVANAMLAAWSAPGARGALFDLPGGETLTYREMVRRIFASVGRRPVLLRLPLGLARGAFYAFRTLTGVRYSAASLERMNMALTLDPAPVREVLRIDCRPFRPVFPAGWKRAG